MLSSFLQSKLVMAVLTWGVVLLAAGYLIQSSHPTHPHRLWWVLGALWLVSSTVMSFVVIRTGRMIEELGYAFRHVADGNYETDVKQPSGGGAHWYRFYREFRAMQTAVEDREQFLRQLIGRFEALLHSMTEGVLAIDARGEIILANQAASRMLAFNHEPNNPRKLLDLVRIPEFRAALQTVQESSIFQVVEFKTLHEPVRLLKATITMLEDKQFPGVAIVLQDVTELRVLETMRRDFVANVSHEFKTPLASIKAYAETLRMGAINDPKMNLSFVEQIESQADLLNLQVQDIMSIARIESGKMSVDVEPTHINPLCIQCADDLADLAKRSGLTLKLELDGEGPVIMASASGLLTIMHNLVKNAISYTPVGGSVTICVVEQDGIASIAVIDTGIGIDPSQHDRVFERFYRVDKARSRDVGGTGLGLAIVKHTVQVFDGTVTLDSQVGKGSTFTIRFPSIAAVSS